MDCADQAGLTVQIISIVEGEEKQEMRGLNPGCPAYPGPPVCLTVMTEKHTNDSAST